jgi:hypothetical protein
MTSISYQSEGGTYLSIYFCFILGLVVALFFTFAALGATLRRREVASNTW